MRVGPEHSTFNVSEILQVSMYDVVIDLFKLTLQDDLRLDVQGNVSCLIKIPPQITKI